MLLIVFLAVIIADMSKKKVCVINPHFVVSEPISCILHRDKEHRHIVDACGYCDDFYCINAIDNKSK